MQERNRLKWWSFASSKLAIAGILLLTACSPENGNQAPDTRIKLFILDCGYLLVKNLDAFSPGDNLSGPKQLVNSCYLIQHPKGTLIWDTGLDDALLGKPQKRKNLDVEVRHPLMTQLAEIGVRPDKIDFIALSHLHFDHTGNANRFTEATWLIQRSEHAVAFDAAGREQGFNPESYEKLKKNPLVLLDGDYDVFRDGKVRIISAPGHTIGHQMLWVELENFGPVLLSGDLYHFQENRSTGNFPRFNYDAEKTRESITRIENILANTNPKPTLIIQHDAAQSTQLPYAPAFLY